MNRIYKFLLISLISVFPLRAMEHAQLARQHFDVAGQLTQELLKQDLTPAVVAVGAGLSAVSLAGIFFALRVSLRSNHLPATEAKPQNLLVIADSLGMADPLLHASAGDGYKAKVELATRPRSGSDASASSVLSLVPSGDGLVTGDDSVEVSPRSGFSASISSNIARQAVSVDANELVKIDPKKVLEQAAALARGRLKRKEQDNEDAAARRKAFDFWRKEAKQTKESKQMVREIVLQLIAHLPEEKTVSVNHSSLSSSPLDSLSETSDEAASAAAAASSHEGREKPKVVRQLFAESPKKVEKLDKWVQYLERLAKNRRAWQQYRLSFRRWCLGASSSPLQEPVEADMANGYLNDTGALALDTAFKICFVDNVNPLFQPKPEVDEILKNDPELGTLLRARQVNAALSGEKAFKPILHHIARVAPKKYFKPSRMPKI